MTNVTDYAPIKYGCNGATVDFVFPWKIFENEDVIVQIQDSEGNISTLNYGADFSVQFEAVGGNVKLKSVFETGNSVIISRNVSDYQEKSFSTSPGFQASEIEKSLDRVSCNLQEMDYNIENFKETYSEQVGTQIEDLENVIEENKQEVLVIQERFEDSTNAKIEEFKTETNTAIKDFEDGIDAKIATVADAADKINTLDESIQLCRESAETATQQAEIATNKADEILNVKDELEAEIGTKANKVDVLTKSQIANCILEFPQRIKYTLENNIFTVKAGTVLIVPYGVEDLTPQYPKGAAFLNENFKVVDTQFDNNLFFVWVELQNDLTNSVATTDSNSRILYLSLNDSQIRAQVYFGSGAQEYDGEKSSVWYRTDENIVKRYGSGVLTSSVCCLPIGFCKADGVHIVGSIEQVFNGMGYIGSTVWVDKDVKGLMPNGRNEDGTLNNIDYTTERISLLTMGSNNLTRYLYIPGSGVLSNIYSTRYFTGNFSQAPKTVPTTSACYFFAVDLNKRFITTGSTTANWVETTNVLDIGSVVEVGGVVSALYHKTPFRVADYQDVVKKTGDTMTGALTISTNDSAKFKCKRLDWDCTSTTAPSANLYIGGVNFYDKNDYLAGTFRNRVHSNGIAQSQVIVRRNINGTDYEQDLSLGIYPDGTSSFVFPKCTTKATTTSSAKTDLVAVVVQNYVNGTSWYRVWSDGWKEQGGIVTQLKTTVTFLKSFSNTNYTVAVTNVDVGTTGSFENLGAYNRTKSTMLINRGDAGYGGIAVTVSWYACGY